MDHLGSDSENDAPRRRFGLPSNRRTFMKRAIGGLAIALPAAKVLSSSAPAAAATSPTVNPNACTGSCQQNHIVEVMCGDDLTSTSCKGADVAACMILWERPNGSTFWEQSGYCYEP
jgi:hypothetical protein